jgi:hypothetical protein
MPKSEFTREDISTWRKDPKTRSREEHQKKRLKKLRTSQRGKREWISIKELAKYDRARVELFYDEVFEAVMDDHFGTDRSNSTIRFLAPGMPNEAKLVPSRLREFRETDGHRYVLENSWIRWDAFDSWCDRTNRPDLKKHFGRKAGAEISAVAHAAQSVDGKLVPIAPVVLDHHGDWEVATQWLSARVDDWRSGKGARLKRSDVEAGLEKDFGYKTPLSRDIWTKNAPDEWKVRGRHKKK